MADKVCSVASILEETREAHGDVLKILKQPIGEVSCALNHYFKHKCRERVIESNCSTVDILLRGRLFERPFPIYGHVSFKHFFSYLLCFVRPLLF